MVDQSVPRVLPPLRVLLRAAHASIPRARRRRRVGLRALGQGQCAEGSARRTRRAHLARRTRRNRNRDRSVSTARRTLPRDAPNPRGTGPRAHVRASDHTLAARHPRHRRLQRALHAAGASVCVSLPTLDAAIARRIEADHRRRPNDCARSNVFESRHPHGVAMHRFSPASPTPARNCARSTPPQPRPATFAWHTLLNLGDVATRCVLCFPHARPPGTHRRIRAPLSRQVRAARLRLTHRGPRARRPQPRPLAPPPTNRAKARHGSTFAALKNYAPAGAALLKCSGELGHQSAMLSTGPVHL